MLINRAIEAVRALGMSNRLLRARASQVASRPPLVLVPSLFGSRLVDARGRVLWGTTPAVFIRGDLGRSDPVRATALLEGFATVPGLWTHDVYGGMVRYLEKVGGYRRGVDLFVLDYDWRAGVVAGAQALARLVRRVVGIGDDAVDLVAVSTGGLIARYFLAYGDADLDDLQARTPPDRIRRVVFVGVPHGGSFHVIPSLVEGLQLAPLTPLIKPREVGRAQIAWDVLPPTRVKLFFDERGLGLDVNHLDPRVWSELGVAPVPDEEMATRLRLARQVHDALDCAPAHPDSLVIGGRNRPTMARAILAQGRLRLPDCVPRRDDPQADFLYESGDGSVVASSLTSVAGLSPDRTWWVEAAHIDLPSDPTVHRLIVEALIATDRHRQAPMAAAGRVHESQGRTAAEPG